MKPVNQWEFITTIFICFAVFILLIYVIWLVLHEDSNTKIICRYYDPNIKDGFCKCFYRKEPVNCKLNTYGEEKKYVNRTNCPHNWRKTREFEIYKEAEKIRKNKAKWVRHLKNNEGKLKIQNPIMKPIQKSGLDIIKKTQEIIRQNKRNRNLEICECGWKSKEIVNYCEKCGKEIK